MHLEKLFQVLPRKAMLANTKNSKQKMERCKNLSIRENWVSVQGENILMELNKKNKIKIK